MLVTSQAYKELFAHISALYKALIAQSVTLPRLVIYEKRINIEEIMVMAGQEISDPTPLN